MTADGMDMQQFCPSVVCAVCGSMRHNDGRRLVMGKANLLRLARIGLSTWLRPDSVD